MFWMFGLFILGCGFTHLMEVVVAWVPLYRLSALVKIITALASWATVAGLIPLVPRVLALRSPRALECEVAERKQAEAALAAVNAELEARVQERTAELVRLNESLQREVEERRRAEAALQEADRRKDEFLAMLAHELRGPMAPIRQALQILSLTGLTDPNPQWARGVIHRQVDHLVRLVDDLMDVSRITRGKIHLRMQPVEVLAILAQAVETSRPLIDARKHQLTVHQPAEEVWVQGDPTRLAQVVFNLLSNAAKYTDEGGTILLAAQRQDNNVVIRVKDNGAGLSADILPRIFDLYAQARGTRDRSQGGLGIGLALVRSLIEMHGGTVEARSDGPGKGSELIIALPVLPKPGVDRSAAPGKDSTSAPAAGQRVLLVEDNQDTAESLSLLLQLWGHEVRVIHDGTAALAAACELGPQVILLDIGLPGLSGLEIVRQLRRDPRFHDTLVVMATGYGQEADYHRSLEAGADLHWVKPIDPLALKALLACPERGKQLDSSFQSAAG